MGRIRIGDKAPDFTLPSSKEGEFTLSKLLEEKNVVVFFYPMDESPVCSREAEAFRDKYSLFRELDGEVIGISSQNVASHRAFVNRHNLPFILLSDEDNSVRKLYGVSTSLGVIPGRVTLFIDKAGIVRHIFASQFQITKHAKEALSALKKLKGRS